MNLTMKADFNNVIFAYCAFSGEIQIDFLRRTELTSLKTKNRISYSIKLRQFCNQSQTS